MMVGCHLWAQTKKQRNASEKSVKQEREKEKAWTTLVSKHKPSTTEALQIFGKKNATSWCEMGATHLAIATHNAGVTDIPGHLSRVEEYLKAVR